MNKTKPKRGMTVSDFIALPDAEKERIYNEIDSKTHEQLMAESRPLNDKEAKQLERIQRRARRGRPKFGKLGTKIVAVTMEKGLLKRADAYAKTQGMKRSELFARGVAAIIGA